MDEQFFRVFLFGADTKSELFFMVVTAEVQTMSPRESGYTLHRPPTLCQTLQDEIPRVEEVFHKLGGAIFFTPGP